MFSPTDLTDIQLIFEQRLEEDCWFLYLDRARLAVYPLYSAIKLGYANPLLAAASYQVGRHDSGINLLN